MQAAALAPPAAALRVGAAGCRRRSSGRPLPQCRAVPRPVLQRRTACIPAARARKRVLAAAGAAAVPEPGGSSAAPPAAAAGLQHKRGWAAQLTPLSDPAANSKLLALSTGQQEQGCQVAGWVCHSGTGVRRCRCGFRRRATPICCISAPCCCLLPLHKPCSQRKCCHP